MTETSIKMTGIKILIHVDARDRKNKFHGFTKGISLYRIAVSFIL